MNLGFSAYLAFVLGVLLPTLGLVRSWLIDDADVWTFLADVICGGMLLPGAVKTRQRAHSGQRFLSAGYAMTFGVFLSSLMFLMRPANDVIARPDGVIPTEFMIVPAIAGLLISGIGLLVSLRSIRSK